ncbi:MAG: hypothetical protein KKC29_08910 [Alphaproteobacteria bacterium]|nr:hypothetical protein [Alphaproteobacteria bacterium]MBU2041180.1 hypothetical protein [Alphaproteobacteria bacterium]MBU2125515.1 hypothetical protein [Alphaproteobacteria bacterium]MBU2208526.1 hypothetical protein [Alphaproteobacteria bacterium]MBU2291209.1 hypothetical protein [Alphaproteobacteria bacterium]
MDRSAALIGLLAEDQAEDRAVLAGEPAYVALRVRDKARREAVMALLAEGWPEDADTLYAAAWVLNHGDLSEEAALASQLAARAAELGRPGARWLAAAALDRSLMYAEHPQKYGTNIVPDGVGWRLWDVDPATTDQERIANDVPPLSEMQARAAAITDPQPDMAGAPGWLTRRRVERAES